MRCMMRYQISSRQNNERIFTLTKTIKMINNSAITELRELLEKASAICSDNAHLAENIDLIGIGDQLDEYVDDLNAIENFEVYGDYKTFNEAPYGEDDGPEYDGAGFTDEDRIVNGQYRVIDADMEAQDSNIFGNNKI